MRALCLLLIVAGASAALLPSPELLDRGSRSASEESEEDSPGNSGSPIAGEFSLLVNATSLDKQLTALQKINFSGIARPLPSIQTPSISGLTNLFGVRNTVQGVRNQVTRSLGGGPDLETALQSAVERALDNRDPLDALSKLINRILQIYYNAAMSTPITMVATAVVQDGLLLIDAIIRVILVAVTSTARI